MKRSFGLALLLVALLVCGTPTTAWAKSATADTASADYIYDCTSNVSGDGESLHCAPPPCSSLPHGGAASPSVKTRGTSTTSASLGVATNTADDFANWGGEFVDDAIRAPATRPDLANISAKIERQMQTRGWTPDLIDEAVTSGNKFPTVNKLGGANTPATRYVSPTTGQSVVIDNATGEIIQVGGPGFKYGP